MGLSSMLLMAIAYWFLYFRKAVPAAYFEKLFVQHFRRMPENPELAMVGMPKHEKRAGDVIFSWVLMLIAAAYLWYSSSFGMASLAVGIFVLGGAIAWVLGHLWLSIAHRKKIHRFFSEMRDRRDDIRFTL